MCRRKLSAGVTGKQPSSTLQTFTSKPASNIPRAKPPNHFKMANGYVQDLTNAADR